MTDELIDLDGLRRLDEQVVAEIYDRFFPDVFRYARYRLGDETLAEDVSSEVFIQMLETLHKPGGNVRDLRAWLFGIANHLVNDQMRRRYRRPEESIPESMADDGLALSEQIEQREHQSLVRSAMRRLTGEQQHILALRFGQGYSLEETAMIVKKNVNAVKAMQFRALAALQREMGTRYE